MPRIGLPVLKGMGKRLQITICAEGNRPDIESDGSSNDLSVEGQSNSGGRTADGKEWAGSFCRGRT